MVTLSNVNDGVNTGNVVVPCAFSWGHPGNAVVTSSDVSQTKLQTGNAVSGSNFREDVVVNGVINGSDVSLVRSRVGSAFP